MNEREREPELIGKERKKERKRKREREPGT